MRENGERKRFRFKSLSSFTLASLDHKAIFPFCPGSYSWHSWYCPPLPWPLLTQDLRHVLNHTDSARDTQLLGESLLMEEKGVDRQTNGSSGVNGVCTDR